MSLLAPTLLAFALVTPQDGKNAPQADGPEALAAASFRLESETRDFAAALDSWSKAEAAATKAGRKELVAKAQLGRARCLKALGKSAEAISILKPLVAADPKNVEAASLLEKLAAPSPKDDELTEIVRQLADVALSLTEPQSDNRMKDAREDLVRMSDIAVPQLADLLRENRVGVVDGAAVMLVRIGTDRSFEALAAALRDPRCRYPRQLRAAQGRDYPLIAAPFYVELLRRPDIESRRSAADYFQKRLSELPAGVQLEVARLALADSDDGVRGLFWNARFGADAVRALVPEFDAAIASGDEAKGSCAAAFFRQNRDALPADVAARWMTQLDSSPNANVRRRIRIVAYDLASSREGHGRDDTLRGLALLRLLDDDDPTNFSSGVDRLIQDGWSGSDVPAMHERLHSAMRRALEIPGLKLATRIAVFGRIPERGLTDEDLFDLFVRAVAIAGDEDPGLRAKVRSDLAMYMAKRTEESQRDAVATRYWPRIPDPAGRAIWFDRWVATKGGERPTRFPRLSTSAAASDDVELRRVAYRELEQAGDANELPYLSKDLRDASEEARDVIVRAIGRGPCPALVPTLRDLFAHSTGAVRRRTAYALYVVGDTEAVPELLEMMRATTKKESFPSVYLKLIEAHFGADHLGQELGDLAKRQGTADSIVEWIGNGWDGISAACASAFAVALPDEFVSESVLLKLGPLLPPGQVEPILHAKLIHGERNLVVAAARFAGRFRIESTWKDLVKLLDSGDGDVRSAATEALKSLRDYRELRRSFAADDSDARRAAFEKAKAMTASKVAEQRAGAAIALAATGDIAAIPPLLDLLGDGDEAVRAAARKALEKLADRAAALPNEAPKHEEEKGAEGSAGKKKQE